MIFSRVTEEDYQVSPFGLYKTFLASKVEVDPVTDDFVSWTQSSQPLESQTVRLSVIDQAVVRCWSSYLLCFEKTSRHSNQEIFSQLRAGLQKTIQQFPFIAGELVPDKDGKEGSLQVNIGPDSGVAFGFRDISKFSIAADLTFEKLRQHDFHPSLMEGPELHIAPDPKTINSLPRQPVFLAQATFVHGGVLLFMAHSHQIADVTGTNSFMRRWSENVSAIASGFEPQISTALRDCSMGTDRQRLSHGHFDASIPESSFPMLITRADTSTKAPKARHVSQEQNPSLIWHMDSAHLQLLKDLAQPTEDDEYISTLDAVNALFWRTVCRARQLSERDISSSRLFFVCDIRSKLQPPMRPDSTCNATMKLHATQTSTDIQDQDLQASLSRSASSIRRAIQSFSPSQFETWISYVKSAPSFFSLQAQESLRYGPDIVVTDHSKVGAYSHTWGPLLGSIARIRNPWWARSAPKPFSQITYMPRLKDGGLEILTNFGQEINEWLLEDHELKQFASIRCC